MNNENLMIFYYLIKSELEKLKSDKLSFSRLQPCEIVSKKIGYKEKRKIANMEKLRKYEETLCSTEETVFLENANAVKQCVVEIVRRMKSK